jgi:hypothetical protein
MITRITLPPYGTMGIPSENKGTVMVEPDRVSVSARIRWIRTHVASRRQTHKCDRPTNEVATHLRESLNHEFPSPRGQPVIGGRIVGTNPVRIRIRAFPHGARVGLTYGGNRGDWMKPSLVGSVVGESDDSCEVHYHVGSNGVFVALAAVILSVLAVLDAIGLAVFGTWEGALISLGVGVVLAVVFTTLLSQTDQGVREEGLLLRWITTNFQELAAS